MRYLVTPDFTVKVACQPAEIRQLVSSLLRKIELSDKDKLMSQGLFGIPPLAFENDIFVFSSQSQFFSVYVTFGSDKDGEYILLMDFTLHRKIPSVSMASRYRNPHTNNLYNPRRNPSINPKRNPSINPRRNSSINPRRNSSINPRRNSSINPRRNPSINLRRNPSINPRRSPSINPRRNPSINPRRNQAYKGPFIYSCELQQEGFMVRANDNVELIFDLNNELTSICVRANQNVFALFDTDNEWIGFLVTANNEVRLRFNLDNYWTGIVL